MSEIFSQKEEQRVCRPQFHTFSYSCLSVPFPRGAESVSVFLPECSPAYSGVRLKRVLEDAEALVAKLPLPPVPLPPTKTAPAPAEAVSLKPARRRFIPPGLQPPVGALGFSAVVFTCAHTDALIALLFKLTRN